MADSTSLALAWTGSIKDTTFNTMEPKPSYRSLDRAETLPPCAFCIGALLNCVLN
jgi:hypothetical protein